jgi:hypothetical protein
MLLLAACATDAFTERLNEKSATVTLSAADRDRLKAGNIQKGDTMDMVYIAKGKPDRTSKSEYGPIWTYVTDVAAGEIVGAIPSGNPGSNFGPGGARPQFNPAQAAGVSGATDLNAGTKLEVQILFVNGKVGWIASKKV